LDICQDKKDNLTLVIYPSKQPTSTAPSPCPPVAAAAGSQAPADKIVAPHESGIDNMAQAAFSASALP